MLDDLSDAARQRKLRERGYLDYTLTLRISQGPRTLEERSVPVVVVHQLDDTRHVDDARHLAPGLDALTRTPWLHEVDHALSAGTAAQDVSPARHYHGRHAFAPGDRGVGMLDPRKLYAAMPLWWDVAAVASQGWADAAPVAELTFEQPGVFSLSAELSEDAYRNNSVQFHNDLWSELGFNAGSGHWHLNHRDEVRYQFGTDYPLPNLPKLFDAARQLWDGQDPTTLRLPLARGTDVDDFATDLVPMRMRINTHERWGVNLYFRTDNKASAYPDHIQQNASGSRTLRRFYQEGADRPLVYRSRLADDDLTLNYSYDAHGYLTSVTRNGQRERRYEWEDLGVAMDGHRFKRLRKITQGDELIEYRYADAETMRVSEVVTSFGTKAVTLVEAHADGTTKTLRLQGLDTPDQVRSFDLSQGVLLSSSMGYGAGGQQLDYARTWTAIDDAQRREWRLLTDAYQNQTYAYDTKARMLSATRLGRTTAWTYGNPLRLFRLYPDSLTDPAGQTFAIETTRNQSTISLGDLSETTHYGGDGAVLGVTDVNGFGDLAERSKLFAPADDRHSTANGRPTAMPYYGETTAVFEAAYNSFGEPIQIREAGVLTEFIAYDDLGRPTAMQLMGDRTVSRTYAYQGNRFVVTETEAGAGVTTVTYYDELGRVRQTERTQTEGTVVQVNTFDTLSRLTQSTVDGESVFQATFTGDRPQPDTLTHPQQQETLTYTYGVDQRITGLTRTVGTLSETIPFQTDVLGRVIRERIDGIGIVAHQYDAFNRRSNTQLAADVIATKNAEAVAALEIRYEYGYLGNQPMRQIYDDFLGVLTTEIFGDPEGRALQTRREGYKPNLSIGSISVPRGLATDQILRVTTTIDTFSLGDKGHLYKRAISGGEVLRTEDVSSLGHLFGQSYGRYQTKAQYANLGRFGDPTTWTGSFTGAQTHDAQGRVTTTTDVHGLTTEVKAYDKFNRATQILDPRGKTHDIGYFGLTQTPGSINATEPAVAQKTALTVPTWSKSDILSATSTNWMGSHTQNSVTQLSRQMQQTKLSDGNATATMDLDPDLGLNATYTDFAGDTHGLDTLPGGRGRTYTAPDGTQRTEIYDAFGRLEKTYRNQTPIYEVTNRDRDGRPLRVIDQDDIIDYTYDNEDLTRVVKNGQTMDLQNYNAAGQPENIQFGASPSAPDFRGGLSLGYGVGGRLQSLASDANSGDDVAMSFNPFGDLTALTRTYGDDVQFTHNAWGAPAQMTFEGVDYSLFEGDAANLRVLDMPAGNQIELDTEGRQIRHTIPGLAERTSEYDGQGRVTKLFQDGVLWQEFDYADGRLSERRAFKDGALDVQYQYAYDGYGRIQAVTDVLSSATFTWTYYDQARDIDQNAYTNRVKTYTDANGVTYTYSYDEHGRTTRIALSGGPTFVYDYDDYGNLSLASVDGMGAEFGVYERGYPTTMTWLGGSAARSFDLTQTEGRLDDITSTDQSIGLNLTWTGDAITEVERIGPTFEETLTPGYTGERLQSLTITRGTGQTIVETTDVGTNRLLSRLQRTVDAQTVLDLTATAEAGDRRIGQLDGGGVAVLDPGYDAQGNLITLDRNTSGGIVQDTFTYDAMRRLTGLTLANGAQPITLDYTYDPSFRRIAAQETGRIGKIVYAYHGSKLLATGVKVDQTIQWYQAFLHGPLGPILSRDLTGHGQDAFIFPDQVGTPFAYIDAQDGSTTYTPYSPLGEALFPHPTPVPGLGEMPGAATPNLGTGYQLPSQPPVPATVDQLGALHTALGALPTLGLGGHPYDALTGTTYMHHRHYHPRLGHFLTPDFRAPDLLDPSTVVEPYAYAAGNPVLYWDADGLAVKHHNDGSVSLTYKVKGNSREIKIPSEIWQALLSGEYAVDNLIFGKLTLSQYLSLGERKRSGILHDEIIGTQIESEKFLARFLFDPIIHLIKHADHKDLSFLVKKLKASGVWEHLEFKDTGITYGRFQDLSAIEAGYQSRDIIYNMVEVAARVDSVANTVSQTAGGFAVASSLTGIGVGVGGAFALVSTVTGIVSAQSKFFIADHTDKDYNSAFNQIMWVGIGAFGGMATAKPLSGVRIKQAGYGTGYTFAKGKLFYTGSHRAGQFIPNSLAQKLLRYKNLTQHSSDFLANSVVGPRFDSDKSSHERIEVLKYILEAE